MKRRQFINSVAIGTTTTVALAACDQQTNSTGPIIQTDETQPVQWRMVSSYTPSLDTVYGGSEVFVKRVKELQTVDLKLLCLRLAKLYRV